VWVIDAGCEIDLWRLERIVGWEVYGKEKDAALKGTIALASGIMISHLVLLVATIRYAKENSITYWTHNRSLPVKLRKSKNVSMSLCLYVARDGPGAQERHKLTRSSPIGPAEHEEGGSLVCKIRQKEFGVSVALSRTWSASQPEHSRLSTALPSDAEYAHRPRSVSSLLMRFRAIAGKICVNVRSL